MIEDTLPDPMGYVAIHLPEVYSWQGFYLLPYQRRRGDILLANARRTGGGKVVGAGLPGVSSEDCAAVGVLSRAIAKLYSLVIAAPPPSVERAEAIRAAIGSTAYALHLATASRWLLTIGWRDEHQIRAMETRLYRIDAATIDAARELILAEIKQVQASWGVTELVNGRLRRRQPAQPSTGQLEVYATTG